MVPARPRSAVGGGWRAAAAASWASLLDLVFPPTCTGCGRAGQVFCDRCAQAVLPLLPPLCARCGQPLQAPGTCAGCARGGRKALAMARAAALYEEPLRAAIHALKYEGRTELAEPLGRYLVEALSRDEWRAVLPALDGIVPVPLHAQRLAERGYNQAALLAAALCARTGLPHEPGWMARHKETRPQVGLGAAERRANVAASFTATRPLPGAYLLLVDDVYTTGATLTACAEAALDAGAAAVFALTLARPLLAPAAGPLP